MEPILVRVFIAGALVMLVIFLCLLIVILGRGGGERGPNINERIEIKKAHTRKIAKEWENIYKARCSICGLRIFKLETLGTIEWVHVEPDLAKRMFGFHQAWPESKHDCRGYARYEQK